MPDVPGGWTVVRLDSVDSTNDYLKKGTGSLPDRLAVTAERQTAGRGRLDRTWSSPPGGLYASLLFKPPPAPENASHVSLLAADVICGILGDAGIVAEIKWPNDVLAGGRKIAGILPEYGSFPLPWFILGIGINLVSRPDLPDGRGLEPAAWSEFGPAPDPREVLADFLGRMDAAWPDRERDPLSGRAGAISGRLWMQGGEARIRRGPEIVSGIVRGISEEGFLLLETAGGIRSFDSGELRPLQKEYEPD